MTSGHGFSPRVSFLLFFKDAAIFEHYGNKNTAEKNLTEKKTNKCVC